MQEELADQEADLEDLRDSYDQGFEDFEDDTSARTGTFYPILQLILIRRRNR